MEKRAIFGLILGATGVVPMAAVADLGYITGQMDIWLDDPGSLNMVVVDQWGWSNAPPWDAYTYSKIGARVDYYDINTTQIEVETGRPWQETQNVGQVAVDGYFGVCYGIDHIWAGGNVGAWNYHTNEWVTDPTYYTDGFYPPDEFCASS